MDRFDRQPAFESRFDDRALYLWSHQQRAHHVALLLCRIQQRLESRLLVNTGIPVLTDLVASGSGNSIRAAQIAAWQTVDGSPAFAVAREAEVLAVTEELKHLDAIPDVTATSLAGVVAKLEMIVGADREIDSPNDFPWPQIASVLRDMKAIVGDIGMNRPERATVRTDVARHWEAAAKLVAALEEEDALERCGQTG